MSRAPIFALALSLCGTPVAVAGPTAPCTLAAALDPAFERDATPRPDRTAEIFALAGSEGLVADEPIYRRIALDLAVIDAESPGLGSLGLTTYPLPDSFFVTFVDEATQDRAENGEIPELECLLSLLDLSSASYPNLVPDRASYQFDGIYDTEEAREIFELLPDVAGTAPNFSVVSPPNGCYYSPDGIRRIYFLDEVEIFFPSASIERWTRSEVGPGGLLDFQETDTGPPPWAAERDACLAGELGGTLTGPAFDVLEIPTLSHLGLVALVALLAAVARRRLPAGPEARPERRATRPT